MTYKHLLVTKDEYGVCTVTLNRPKLYNALSGEVALELIDMTTKVNADDSIRCVVLTGAGKAFCAGGDLNWMQEIRKEKRDERIKGSAVLAQMLYQLDRMNKPLIGKINGTAYGGGFGLTSVCDIAIGVRGAMFSLSEVTLGLLPANIAPFVVKKLGESNARSIILNARPIDADEAVRYQLLTRAVDADELDDAITEQINFLLRCGPRGVSETKRLVHFIAENNMDDVLEETAIALADAWESDQGKEGIAAFLEKRKPNWYKTI